MGEKYIFSDLCQLQFFFRFKKTYRDRVEQSMYPMWSSLLRIQRTTISFLDPFLPTMQFTNFLLILSILGNIPLLLSSLLNHYRVLVGEVFSTLASILATSFSQFRSIVLTLYGMKLHHSLDLLRDVSHCMPYACKVCNT